jgi:hypothetical protein
VPVTPFRLLQLFLIHTKLEGLPRDLLPFPGYLQVYERERAARCDFAAPKRIRSWTREGRLRRMARSFLSKRTKRLRRMAVSLAVLPALLAST